MTKEKFVIENLLRNIREMYWTPGSFLPGEMHLTKQFGVSRVTLRRALKRLEEYALIERQRGRGTRLLRIPSKEEEASILAEASTLRPPVKYRVFSKQTYQLAFYCSYPETDPLFQNLHAGITTQAKEHGHEILMGGPRPRSLDANAEQYKFPNADGIIFFDEGIRDEDVPMLSKIPFPYILIGNKVLNNAITTDWAMAYQLAVEELARSGHRHIAVLEKHWSPIKPRGKEILRDLERKLPTLHITYSYGSDPLSQLMPIPTDLTGLFVYDDYYAIEVCRSLTKIGRAPGAGMQLISQTTRNVCLGLPPEVDRLEFDFTQWGSMAVLMLERLLEKNERICPPIRMTGRLLPGKSAERV